MARFLLLITLLFRCLDKQWQTWQKINQKHKIIHEFPKLLCASTYNFLSINAILIMIPGKKELFFNVAFVIKCQFWIWFTPRICSSVALSLFRIHTWKRNIVIKKNELFGVYLLIEFLEDFCKKPAMVLWQGQVNLYTSFHGYHIGYINLPSCVLVRPNLR